MPTLEEAPWLLPASIDMAVLILGTHRSTYGRSLLVGNSTDRTPRQLAQELFTLSTVVLAHDGGREPRFTYANREALRLWRRRWPEMVGLPSHRSAEPRERRARATALDRARRYGAVEGYGGFRVDSSGRSFRIEGARLWNLSDPRELGLGQAAAFNSWWWI